ncbi:MAG: selenocysteine-specific translation elongation factor [Pirellulales bacterium]|nr:selenocysteine-specific translation elongation factor [Pirellulales bacterium]
MGIDLILGTAGHVDHGKTALIRALTGVDTDRLPEEKRRGITIELGFARLELGEYCLGVVDVPGHERFIRNMLTGATGIDLALLVVGADESVKAQTREHVDILRLLDTRAGVIALTKCDLVEPAWIELVEAEVRALVANSFLRAAPIVRVSSATGAGLDALRIALAEAAASAARSVVPDATAPFRMAIDRAFTVAGHGTVVTGSVASGVCRLGDELVIEPGGVAVRVRGLQNHDRPVAEVHRGQRAAVNLAGVHHDQIRRGQELATPGHLVPSRLLSVEAQVLRHAARGLQHRERLRVHVGTAEVSATVSLPQVSVLAPGERGLIQLLLAEPVVATWRQPLVLRRESPAETLGGGHVLDPGAERIPRNVPAVCAQLAALGDSDPLKRAAAAIYFRGLRCWADADLIRLVGIARPGEIVARLIESGEVLILALSPTRNLRVHREVVETYLQRIEGALMHLHAAEPLAVAVERSRLVARFAGLGDRAIVEALVDLLVARHRVRVLPKGIALASHGPRLTSNEQKLLAELVAAIRQAGLQPPTVAELQAGAKRNRDAVPQLLQLAAGQGHLVDLGGELFVHAEHEARARELLLPDLAGAGLTVSQIKDRLGISRKHAVPLCEYFDRVGFTRREGDLRRLAATPAAV